MWLINTKGQFYSIFKIIDELLFLKLNVILIACVCQVREWVGEILYSWNTLMKGS